MITSTPQLDDRQPQPPTSRILRVPRCDPDPARSPRQRGPRTSSLPLVHLPCVVIPTLQVTPPTLPRTNEELTCCEGEWNGCLCGDHAESEWGGVDEGEGWVAVGHDALVDARDGMMTLTIAEVEEQGVDAAKGVTPTAPEADTSPRDEDASLDVFVTWGRDTEPAFEVLDLTVDLPAPTQRIDSLGDALYLSASSIPVKNADSATRPPVRVRLMTPRTDSLADGPTPISTDPPLSISIPANRSPSVTYSPAAIDVGSNSDESSSSTVLSPVERAPAATHLPTPPPELPALNVFVACGRGADLPAPVPLPRPRTDSLSDGSSASSTAPSLSISIPVNHAPSLNHSPDAIDSPPASIPAPKEACPPHPPASRPSSRAHPRRIRRPAARAESLWEDNAAEGASW
ncbi:hypothetical protein BDK51DRAFT_40772 [Blyttiomyces helicus]|uniref:Uncharacterized protein n=1 Tax=Blyttiomyces helicus TaxID=388810 RepID=A0A4P9W477_9FUNG|nr:hypothetical protein BDK51DRAFT_40772 [Blyttiomyces helicus]|eukprot:RKO84976.1 hypothetical protein BDK51DRAFT_40772 [Blyttiomyces helicus]